MSLTTVAELRTALGIGTLYADSVLQSVCDASDDVMLPFLWTNTTPVIARSNLGTVGTLYFDIPVRDVFFVGETINVEGCGANFNGNKTITEVNDYDISFTTSQLTDIPRQPVNPYGVVSATTFTDYTAIAAIQEASLMISVAIWQARQAPTGQGVSIDGYAPSPYTMSNQLMARVRGLLAPYLSPNSMVG